MTVFRAQYSAGTCHGCKKPIRQGDSVEYLPRDFPHEPMSFNAKTVLWHETCGSQALVAALCSACHLIHDGEDGSCLL